MAWSPVETALAFWLAGVKFADDNGTIRKLPRRLPPAAPGARHHVTIPASTATRRPASRFRRAAAVGALVVVLAVAGTLGWRWYQDRAERQTAFQRISRQQFDAAIPLLEHQRARHPDDVEVVRALALGYLDARQFPEAETALNGWCALRPHDGEPLRHRLHLWTQQQNLTQSVADAESILRIDPNDQATRQQLARWLYLAGRHDEAERQAQRCLQAQPDNTSLLLLLASIHHHQGRNADAAAIADRLLRAVPDHANGLALRAQLHLEANEFEPAIQLFQRAALIPGQQQPTMLYQLSVALDRAGRHQEAQQALAEMQWRRALGLWSEDNLRDENAGLQGRVVQAYLAAGKTDEAVRFLTGILERNPRAAGAHRLLADCYDKQGQPERAAEHRRLAGATP
jgi:tetratricopeptide (TPR) repeat protein